MKREEVLAIYGSHDASVTFIDKNGELRVYEYERFVKKRYAMYSSRFDYRADLGTNEESRKLFLSHLKSNLKSTDIKLILHLEIDENDMKLLSEFFPQAEFKLVGHHFAHACSGYYSSGFEEALIVSIDGGGWDNGRVTTTNAYLGSGKELIQIECPGTDFGNPYAGIGHLISEVSPSPEGRDSIHALSYAGKIMGLCAYGTVRYDWLPAMREYYNGDPLHTFCWKVGIPYGYNSLQEQTSYDLAATSQHVFEEKVSELVDKLLNKHQRDVVLVGGCALNVLYNQQLKQKLNAEGLNLYVPPNPNDCGLSYGMFLSMFPEEGQSEVCYSGIEILDEQKQEELLTNYNAVEYTVGDVVDLLKQGKILGVIDGYSEVGPRALGNRSIICDPSFDGMKDTLNAKVKFREWFRPFAPVCRLEDASKFFSASFEAKYMSYAPTVRKDYREALKAITHIDNTARLQTVEQCDHRFFYDVLTELNERQHIPVILNTSFNIKGKPILTTIEDALYVLDNTELDYVVTNKYIVSRKV